MKKVILPYRPRWYQICIHNAFRDGFKRVFALFHRRAGKDICAWNFMIEKACKGIPGTYYYVCPSYTQAKKIIWTAIDEDGFKVLDYIPKSFITKVNQQDMRIELVNGSAIQVVGCENYDSLRGTNPRGVVFSEYAMMDPRVWTEVISPILRKNGGWAFFQTTPLGRNHAFDLWQMAQTNDEWYTTKITVEDTDLIPKSEIDKERAEGKEEAIIEQEYYCSFSKGLHGAYYQSLIDKMHRENKITSVPWNSSLPVDVAFDLGVSDSTAIIFFQQAGREVHVIDSEEHSGQGIPFYVKLLQDKPYTYRNYFFPHDLAVRELGTGQARAEVFRSLGVEPTILPNQSINLGIESARRLLTSLCWIDKNKCKGLVKALEHYHRVYDERNRVLLDRPKHDWSSHFADCFRYLSISVGQTYAKPTATAEHLRNLQRKHRVIA